MNQSAAQSDDDYKKQGWDVHEHPSFRTRFSNLISNSLLSLRLSGLNENDETAYFYSTLKIPRF